MIALVMCGGKGKRMQSSVEKLLLNYKKPIIEHVLDMLKNSKIFSRIICVTSKNAPNTHQFVINLGFETIETQGLGYSEDLGETLERFTEPVFVISGDLPLLDSIVIKNIIDLVNIENAWNTVMVKKKLIESIGSHTEFFVKINGVDYAYTGISIINPRKILPGKITNESFIIIDDKRVALNINTTKDYELLCTT